MGSRVVLWFVQLPLIAMKNCWTVAVASTASPAAGFSSLLSISTCGPPVHEGNESALNDKTIPKYLSSAKKCILPYSFIRTLSSVAFWPLTYATKKVAVAAAVLLADLARN